jgi:hypothetical protein
MNIQHPPVAPCARLDERFWLMRNFALELVRHLGATSPPVMLDGLLTSPPPGLKIRMCSAGNPGLQSAPANGASISFEGETCQWRGDERREARYQLGRRILSGIALGEHGLALGLPDLIGPQMADCQDYFARVLLAPDFLVAAYRQQGDRLSGFGSRFLIPDRVAFQRWMDPVFPD